MSQCLSVFAFQDFVAPLAFVLMIQIKDRLLHSITGFGTVRGRLTVTFHIDLK